VAVDFFVFSSSAAAYGMPDVDPVEEDTECRPVNPYGSTKLIGEWMAADVARTTGLTYADLRYFTVGGAASPSLADHGAANLVPLVFQQLSDHRWPPLGRGGARGRRRMRASSRRTTDGSE
jgi:UDP-glucose 4-epimerase